MHWIKYETHNFSSHFCFFSITEKLVIYFRNIPGILFFLLKCLYAMIIFNIFLLKCFKQSIMEINKTFQHVLSVLYTHVCEWMNDEWCIYIALLLCIAVHPKRFTIMWGGLSSTTTSVQHPLGWCDGSHRTTAPVRSPHTSYRWRGERDRANQVDGDYWEAMIDKGQWREIGQDTGVTPLLFTMSVMGFLMTTESQDLGLTSHPKDSALLTV